MFENEIIGACIAMINRTPHIEARLIQNELRPQLAMADTNNARFDAVLLIRARNRDFIYLVEAKNNVTKNHAHYLATTLPIYLNKYKVGQKKADGILVFANYINQPMAEELQRLDIEYVDTTGNMFLNRPPQFFVDIQGKKPEKVQGKKTGRLLMPAGLKVIVNLLDKPQLANLPKRIIGYEAGVALGTVVYVMEELLAGGYIVKTGRNTYELRRRQELLDKWVIGYADRLRPQLFINKYIPRNTNTGQELTRAADFLEAQDKKHAVTGGVAADLLIQHYRGPDLVLHAEEWDHAWAKTLEWLPADNGPITILKGFGLGMFNGPVVKDVRLALYPMIYAELLATGGEREAETANMIYEKFLKDQLDG